MKGQISSVKGSLLPQFPNMHSKFYSEFFAMSKTGFSDFDIAALDLVFFEWSYLFPYARIRFPLYLPPI